MRKIPYMFLFGGFVVAGLFWFSEQQDALACHGKLSQNCVVVEMFTSQGCSSCPPADRLLGNLQDDDRVLALSQHVDYWDYIGWKDTFAEKWISLRQRRYSTSFGQRSVYTPQAIISGRKGVVGSNRREVMKLVERAHELPKAVILAVVQSDQGKGWNIEIRPGQEKLENAEIYLVSYLPKRRIAVKRGENAGQEIEYHNIVRSWRRIAGWDGETVKNLTLDDKMISEFSERSARTDGELSHAILVQLGGSGPIVAASVLSK